MTYAIIFVTVVVSLMCFNNGTLFRRLALDPWMVWHKREWWRIITHGFVHADFTHLFINMLVFWSFGMSIEHRFKFLQQEGTAGNWALCFLLLYFGGMIAASAYDVIKRRNTVNFLSVGASGAVSAIIFCSVFFAPLTNIYFFGILPIPGILFAVLYLLYERYMASRQMDNVNHFAHMLGAVYGFVFPLFLDPSLIHTFMDEFSR